jgi:hypothetical protein
VVAIDISSAKIMKENRTAPQPPKIRIVMACFLYTLIN